MNKNLLYRKIPKVDVLMENNVIKQMAELYGYDGVLEAVRMELDKLRAYIASCENEEEAERQMESLMVRIELTAADMHRPNMTRVLNGTGTILHTNLGRAPLSAEHLKQVAYIAGATPIWNMTWKKAAGGSGILISKGFYAGSQGQKLPWL